MTISRIQARIIIWLHKTVQPNRSAYFIAAKAESGITHAAGQLKILTAMGLLNENKSKANKKYFYDPTPESFKIAMEILNPPKEDSHSPTPPTNE